jgi:hypothetical protein
MSNDFGDEIGDDPFGPLVDAQFVLSRLSPEQSDALDDEIRWLRMRQAAGRIPSPEKLVAKAPIYLGLVTQMKDLAAGRDQ